LEWKIVAARLGIAPATAVYLYSCDGKAAYGVRRAIIATLGLAGPRVTELCQLDTPDIDLVKARIHIRDAKTEAGVRTVDIQPRLLDDLARYFGHREATPPDAPALPTRTGTRRNKDNVRQKVIEPVVRRANDLRASRGETAIRVHVTPHTFRRTYSSFMLAAGFDLPYVQDQVGHLHPTTTLAIYAKVIRRRDRDRLRAEIRELLGAPETTAQQPPPCAALAGSTSGKRPETAARGSYERAGRN
jgi:integrase